MIDKDSLKRLLGDIPLTAEMYWLIRQGGRPLSRSFTFDQLEKSLPEWCRQAQQGRKKIQKKHNVEQGQKILIICTLRYWINYCTLLGIALYGLGHEVTFAFFPYANWWAALSHFNIRRQNAYAKKVLKLAEPCIHPVSLYDLEKKVPVNGAYAGIPAELQESVKSVSLRDAQYTLQVEEIETTSPDSTSGALYHLRLKRNLSAAHTLYSWLHSGDQSPEPDVVLTPNGSILEMGAAYQTARFLNIPTITFEFGEQRGRIWFDLNREVMHQITDELWEARKDQPFTTQEQMRVQDLYESRQNASLWKNFSRLWQDLPSQGGDRTREELGLDSRPVVLLAANVIGDSLTLGRQIFSRNMTEWLNETVQYFAGRQDAQLVIRVHPGEKYTQGPSVADLVMDLFPNPPEQIHVVQAEDKINTYDLIELADLGLVYTTTVGMEMAMSGIPVIATGHTHYRGKGFTFDPQSWEEYINMLESFINAPAGENTPSKAQVEEAWHYAYCFFFEYPNPFPWHLRDFWEEMDTWSMERVISEEGQSKFGDVFRCLAGQPRDWKKAPVSSAFSGVERELSIQTNLQGTEAG